MASSCGEHPTGTRVSDDGIAALPITRHRFHGDWNYTLHPHRPTNAATTASTQDRALAHQPARPTRRSLQDPEPTGMPRRQRDERIDVLTPAMEIRREQVLPTRRGHERLTAPGTGAEPELTSADRVLATVLNGGRVGSSPQAAFVVLDGHHALATPAGRSGVGYGWTRSSL